MRTGPSSFNTYNQTQPPSGGRPIRSDGFQLTRERWLLWSLQATAKAQAQPNPIQPNPTQPVWLSSRATQRNATQRYATQRNACSGPSGLASHALGPVQFSQPSHRQGARSRLFRVQQRQKDTPWNNGTPETGGGRAPGRLTAHPSLIWTERLTAHTPPCMRCTQVPDAWFSQAAWQPRSPRPRTQAHTGHCPCGLCCSSNRNAIINAPSRVLVGSGLSTLVHVGFGNFRTQLHVGTVEAGAPQVSWKTKSRTGQNSPCPRSLAIAAGA